MISFSVTAARATSPGSPTNSKAGLNIIIKGLNFLIRAINLIPGIRIPLIPKLDVSSLKGELTDIGALNTKLALERDAREAQFEAAGQQVVVNIENLIGLDAEDTSKSLSEELNTKISI